MGGIPCIQTINVRGRRVMYWQCAYFTSCKTPHACMCAYVDVCVQYACVNAVTDTIAGNESVLPGCCAVMLSMHHALGLLSMSLERRTCQVETALEVHTRIDAYFN